MSGSKGAFKFVKTQPVGGTIGAVRHPDKAAHNDAAAMLAVAPVTARRARQKRLM